jgi:hypothetical protein
MKKTIETKREINRMQNEMNMKKEKKITTEGVY